MGTAKNGACAAVLHPDVIGDMGKLFRDGVPASEPQRNLPMYGAMPCILHAAKGDLICK